MSPTLTCGMRRVTNGCTSPGELDAIDGHREGSAVDECQLSYTKDSFTALSCGFGLDYSPESSKHRQQRPCEGDLDVHGSMW